MDMLDEEPYLSQKKIANRLGIHPATAKRVLREELGLVRVTFRWIPYKLNDDQKLKRVELSKSLLQVLQNATTKSIKDIITGDETWV